MVINSLTPPLNRSVWQSRSGSHSQLPHSHPPPPPTPAHAAEEAAVRRETKKSGENEGRRVGVVVCVCVHGGVVVVSFDVGPLQHLHIFKSEDECHAWSKQRRANGRAASPLRAKKKPPTFQQHPGRDTGNVVWELRGPLSRAE